MADPASEKNRPTTSSESACWRTPSPTCSPETVTITRVVLCGVRTEDGPELMVCSVSAVLRSSIQELRCPRGQQQADFLDQLRSAFPQLAGDDKPLDLYKSDRSRRLQRLRVTTLTPDEISRTMKPIRVDKTLLYIRLKVRQRVQTRQNI